MDEALVNREPLQPGEIEWSFGLYKLRDAGFVLRVEGNGEVQYTDFPEEQGRMLAQTLGIIIDA